MTILKLGASVRLRNTFDKKEDLSYDHKKDFRSRDTDYGNRFRIVVLGIIALSFGCTDQTAPTAAKQNHLRPVQDRFQSVQVRLKDPRGLLNEAAAGARVRGEQDEMLRIESNIPGFGGFFRDSTGQVIACMKPGSAAVHPALRGAMHAAYASRPEPLIREAMVTASNAQVIDCDYPLSELIAYENRVNYPGSDPVPGYVAAGVSIRRNRLILALEGSESVQSAQQSLATLGIPLGAVKIEIWGKGHATSTWASDIRPVGAGPQLAIYNRTKVPWPSGWSVFTAGSIGFNVRTASGGTYFLTAGHVINSFTETNGAILDTASQAYPKQRTPGSNVWTPKPIGRIWVNPAWTVGPSACDFAGVDYCTTADVAMGIYFSGINPDLRIGTSMHEGLNGQPGSDEINGFYQITGAIPPELVKGTEIGVHKSGSRTGTTTGRILDEPVLSANIAVCWGILVTDPPVPTGCKSQRVLRWIDASAVRGLVADGGDSGGAVFSGDGWPYAALGILIGSFGDIYNGTCLNEDKLDCTAIFHKWSAIEDRIGWGALNPATP